MARQKMNANLSLSKESNGEKLFEVSSSLMKNGHFRAKTQSLTCVSWGPPITSQKLKDLPQFTISCFLVLPILKDVSSLKSRNNNLFLSGMQKHQDNDRYDFLLHDMNMVRWSSRLQVKNALGKFFPNKTTGANFLYGDQIADCEIKGF